MSDPNVIIDAGAIVALLSQEDQFHSWASTVVSDLPIPFFTCESAVSETCFLLQRSRVPLDNLFALFARGSIRVVFTLDTEWAEISTLMAKYSKLPKGAMSLADACLVRLAELNDRAAVLTTDKHFQIYRKHGRRQIPLIAPWIHANN